MTRKSTVKRLPPSILAKVNAMIEGEWTIDDIVAYLGEAGHPKSRSAVGRYSQNIEKELRRLRQSREITAAVVGELGESAAQGKQGRLLVESTRALVHDLLCKLHDQAEASPNASPIDSKDVQQLGKGLAELARAMRLDQDFETKIREQVEKEVRAEAAQRLDGALDEAHRAGERGLSAERVAQLRRDFLGIKAPVIEGEATEVK